MFNLEDEHFRPDHRAIDLIDGLMCELYKLFPVTLETGRILTVAMADPTNIGALDDIRRLLDLDDVIGVPGDAKQIETAIRRHYGGRVESIEDILKSIEKDLQEQRLPFDRGRLKVYLLYFRTKDAVETSKFCGVYSSIEAAVAAMKRFRPELEVKNYPDHFTVDFCVVDNDHWRNGPRFDNDGE